MRGLILLLGCSLIAGCTSLGLKRNTLGQLRTVSDIYQAQVLENLAMFVYDPGSLPYFNLLMTGVNTVSDSGSASSGLTLGRVGPRNLFMVGSEAVNMSLARMATQNWSANPVNDPRRLELMRCAYQKVVGAQMGRAGASESCPDCEERWKTFYRQDATGRVTNECLGKHVPWFAWGSKKDVPRPCDCLQVGHYCGVYVWVLPGGREELTRLTLAILDYAGNQPAAPWMKEVTVNIGLDGKPTIGKSAGQVRATIPIDVPSFAIVGEGRAHEHMLDNNNKLRLEATPVPPPPETFQNTQPPDFQFLNQRLQQLNPPR